MGMTTGKSAEEGKKGMARKNACSGGIYSFCA
jgi:hypothetical protein